MSTKRKKVVVSIERKLEALKRLDKGESLKKIANELGVGRVTISDWKKKRNELEKWYSKRASIANQRKTMKKCEYENVGEALYNWYKKQEGPIAGPTLQEKALSFQKIFKEGGDSVFMASMGWLDRWKKRYGIKQIIVNDKIATTKETTETFNEPNTNNNKSIPVIQDFEEPKKICHIQGIKALDAALAYVAQQDEATASDLMFFRCWRDLAARKRSATTN